MIEKHRQQQFREPDGFRGKFATFIAGIPYKYIAGAGRVLGMLMYSLDVPHRRIVRRNLKFVYPEWKQDRIKQISKRIFQNIGITIMEICQMTCFSKDDILRKARIRGEDNIENALKEQRGAVIISAHLGNWEMGPLFVPFCFNTPFVGVARKLRFKPINRLILRIRTRFGGTVIDKEEALSEMMRTLRRGQMIGIMVDQGTKRSESVDVTFLGHKVRSTPAAALLAIRCKSPVIPVFCIRDADGRLAIIVEKPLELIRTKDLRSDLITNTQIMTDAIEKAVRTYPDQWFWVHKRWKHHYPDMFPEYQKKRIRRRAKKVRRPQSGSS